MGKTCFTRLEGESFEGKIFSEKKNRLEFSPGPVQWLPNDQKWRKIDSASFGGKLHPDLKIRLRVYPHKNVVLISGKRFVGKHNESPVF